MIIASLFRNAAGYVDRYVHQIEQLVDQADQRVRVVAVEGDSDDDTYARLVRHGLDPLRCEHGGKMFGHVDDPQRWRQIAAAGNVALCAAVREIEPGEPFVWVESDILCDPRTLLALIVDLEQVSAVAPLCLRSGSDLFFDVWGHVGSDGQQFAKQRPYHPSLTDGLTRILSAGSCFALRAEMLPLVQFSPVDCIRGIGRTLRDHGHNLYLDSRLTVRHP